MIKMIWGNKDDKDDDGVPRMIKMMRGVPRMIKMMRGYQEV